MLLVRLLLEELASSSARKVLSDVKLGRRHQMQGVAGSVLQMVAAEVAATASAKPEGVADSAREGALAGGDGRKGKVALEGGDDSDDGGDSGRSGGGNDSRRSSGAGRGSSPRRRRPGGRKLADHNARIRPQSVKQLRPEKGMQLASVQRRRTLATLDTNVQYGAARTHAFVARSVVALEVVRWCGKGNQAPC